MFIHTTFFGRKRQTHCFAGWISPALPLCCWAAPRNEEKGSKVHVSPAQYSFSLFTSMDSDRTRGNGFKLEQGRFRLGIRRKFFTQRVVTHWNRLPKEAVDAPSLEAFKARLDVALGSLVQWLVTLHVAGGLKLDAL